MRNHVGYVVPDDDIDLLAIIRIVWSHRYLVACSTMAVGIAAVAYAFHATPVYRAHAVLMQVESDGSAIGGGLLQEFGGLANLAGIDIGGMVGATERNGRVIIQSRTFAEEFIRRNDLLPVIFSDSWDENSGTWSPDLDKPPTIWQGAYALQEAFDLELDSETGLFTLTVEWTDAKLAAQLTNKIVALANQIARERDIETAQRSVQYLKDQIDGTNVIELQRVLYSLLENEQKTLMLANARDEYVFKVVDPALEPIRRARPNRRLIVALGLVTGFSLGMFFVVISRMIAKVRTRG